MSRRPARLVMVMFLATFFVAVPTAVAQTPVGDQYSAPSGTAATQAGGGGAANGTGAVTGAAPVEVRDMTGAQSRRLPFTGGQISLIALIGLAALALGCAGLASTRRRASTATT